MPWSTKAVYYKRPPPWAFGRLERLSPLQKEHIARFVEAASALYGQSGKVDGLPVVAGSLKGKGRFGGESVQARENRERKRRLRHERVSILVNALRAR
mgnify:CR=1 FL=1